MKVINIRYEFEDDHYQELKKLAKQHYLGTVRKVLRNKGEEGLGHLYEDFEVDANNESA